ncbi:hypothetical protein COI42_28300, partial [Priestia aryabhattai]
MADDRRAITIMHPQQGIVAVRAGSLGESADILQRFAPEPDARTDIVEAGQQIQIEIRLERRLAALAVGSDDIAVAVDG